MARSDGSTRRLLFLRKGAINYPFHAMLLSNPLSHKRNKGLHQDPIITRLMDSSQPLVPLISLTLLIGAQDSLLYKNLTP